MTQDKERNRLLLHAALDGELDVGSALEVERLRARDPELAAEYARLEALRGALSAHASREEAPAALRSKIEDMLATDKPSTLASWRGYWRGYCRGYAAAIAATVALTLAVDRFALSDRAQNEEMRSIVFAHMRAQISGQPVDMPSSDRHNVKPWLASKLPVDAIVLDLAAQGFPLVGARIDIVEGKPTPALVYKRREHLISLTELSGAGFSEELRRGLQDGYPVIEWSDGARAYIAVSDLSPAELASFAEAFRAAAQQDLSPTTR